MSMNSIKDRLLRFIERTGLTVAAFERKAGLSQGYVKNIKGEIGLRKMGGILSAFPELNYDWLLFGEGSVTNRQDIKINTELKKERAIDRFDIYMEFRGLNDNQVTKDASLSVGTIGKSRKEGRDLSKRALNILLETYPDLNRVWLLTGEGCMLHTPKVLPVSIKERVEKFIEYLGVSNYQFEKRTKLSNGYVRSLGSSIGSEKLNQILDAYPELNQEWLLSGEGHMLNTMSTLRDRIKQFIEEKSMSIRAFEKSIGVANGYVSAIGAGSRAEIIENILQTYPELSRDWLLTGEGSMLNRPKIESNAEWVDPSTLNWIEVPVVPYDAMAGIPGGYGDVFPDDLYKKQLVIAPHGAKASDHVIFTVNGDSMEPLLLPGDEILSKYVPSDYYKDSRLHIDHYNVWIIVTRNEGILVKKIIAHDVEHHVLTLHSLNTVYKDFTVDLADVTQIYHAVSLHRNRL